MHAKSLLAAAATLLLAGPAAAACLDEVAQLERRVAQISVDAKTQTAQDEEVEVEMAGGGEREVTTVAADDTANPPENWFGKPPTREGAEAALDNARGAAEEGNVEGCMTALDEAKRIVEALEQG